MQHFAAASEMRPYQSRVAYSPSEAALTAGGNRVGVCVALLIAATSVAWVVFLRNHYSAIDRD